MNNRDTWLSAKALIDRHGEDAAVHATMRADELLDAGDLDGAATWRRIIQATKELESSVPGGVVH